MSNITLQVASPGLTPVAVTRALGASGGSEPVYPGSGLVYVGDSSDPNFASLTAMGAAPLGTVKRLTPSACPAYVDIGTPPASVDTTYYGLVTGKGGTGKAFQNKYPVAADGTQNGPTLVLHNNGTIAGGLEHYFRFVTKYDSSAPMTTQFAIKGLRIIHFDIPYAAQNPQFGTHDHIPWVPSGGVYPTRADGTTNPLTYEYAIAGYDTPYLGDAIQPVGPWFDDVLNDGLYHRHLHAYKPHTASLSVDGVTKLSVSVTATGAAGVGTATFSESMAGRITNGQVISLKPTSKTMGPYTVSSFNGTTGCTLTRVIANQDDFVGTQTTHFALVFDGFMRKWFDGTLIVDVSASAAGNTPSGAKKTWCNLVDVQLIACDVTIDPSIGFRWGGDQTNNPRQAVTQTTNIGNGDPNNLDTLAWWTVTP